MIDLTLSLESIKNRIYTIRNVQVMLDNDLAELYNVPVKALNRAVKRNIERFPSNFMFQLTEKEYQDLKYQFGTSSSTPLRSQIVTSSWGGRRTLPYAFTEQGVAMLSGILKSKTAIEISIKIINAFVIMRRFIAENVDIFHRINKVEIQQIEHDKKFNEIFNAIESKNIKPEKGIFFEGQIFDSYNFVSEIIRSANNSIILIDNYIDDSVLKLFNKRKGEVQVTIFTKTISEQLILDLRKYNQQYPLIEIKEFDKSHDRFLIIDDKEVYHFGASLKDLGKKWFAFSKFDKEVFQLLDRLKLN